MSDPYLYSLARNSVTDYHAARRAELQSAAAAARAANIEATKKAIRESVPAGDPLFALAQCVADALVIGRASDDYPQAGVAVEVEGLLKSAVAVGLLQANQSLGAASVNSSGNSGYVSWSRGQAWEADYEAWKRLRDYPSEV